MIWRMRLTVLAVLASVSLVSAQQHDMGGALLQAFEEPIPLFTVGLGPFTRPISSPNPEAQAYFTQGFQMMYAFAKMDGTRSFREAWKRDPTCAICYWGEAWSWGSYLNGPMTAEEAPHAWAAIRKALSLREHASEKERAFIDAMAVRYVEHFDPERRVDQDRAYAEAMRKVSEAYPDDLDAATLYAEALFLLEPRRGTRDINSPSVQRLHGVLEGVLVRDIRHPGACHLYVHATESTVAPEKAEGCAEYLGNAIPGASHINHMPSHTWNEIGRWGDAVRANIQAWHSDLKAEVGEGFAIYPSHNLHMLLFAASMDGQGAVAMQAGKDYAKLTGDTMYQVLTLVRFGRFDEIPAVASRPAHEIRPACGTSRRATRSCGWAKPTSRRSISRACSTPQRRRRPPSADTPPSASSASSAASSRAKSSGPKATSPAPSRPSTVPSRSTTHSSTTSPSRCPLPQNTGLAPRSSRPAAPQTPSACTGRSSSTTRTTAGRSSGSDGH